MFGFLKKPTNESEKTREQLFLLVERGLQVELGELCRQKSEEISQQFAGWLEMPPKIRSQPKLAQKYAAGLHGVAAKMVELGDDRPMDLLSDGQPSSWRSALRQASELMDKLRFAEAVKILEPYLVTGYHGSQEGADQYQGTTLGKLGECEFQLGHFDKADAHLRKALALCQSQQDWEGVYANLGHLYELDRYRGKPDLAQSHAAALCTALRAQGKDTTRANYNSRTSHAPPVRVVAVLAGVQMEIEELPPATDPAQVSLRLERNRPTLALAAALNAEGRQAYAQGNYASALESFSKAAQLDAYEPDCRYLAGFCLLHLKRYAEASASFKQLERLAPGWAQLRHDSWLAQELAAGHMSHDLWLLELEFWQAAPLSLERVIQALSQYPQHAPLHFAKGLALQALGKAAEANQAYQKALPLAGNEDLKSRILLAASQVIGSPDLCKKLLQHLLSLKLPNLVAAGTARTILRAAATDSTSLHA